jgi:phosphate-selective porin OprO/OprP
MRSRRMGSMRTVLFLALCVFAGTTPDLYSQEPASNPVLQLPPTALTAENLEARLRAMEVLNRKLTAQLEETTRAIEQLKTLNSRVEELTTGQSTGASALVNPAAVADQRSPVPDYTEGGFTPFDPAPGYPGSNVVNPNRFPLRASFGAGFLLQTEDDRYRLQIHYESQVESRIWSQSDQLPANSGIFLPRQRFFFDGHITKWLEYELAINRGLNNINLLNAYLNVHLDDRLQFKFGRFFTPLPYDQYAISNYWMPTPERSPFTTNLGLNRQIGAMVWGYLFNERLDYAVGVFNGSRNSFESQNGNLDVAGYLNARPFQESEQMEFAKFLNIGTSVAFGRQDQSPVPVTFRIAGGSPDANIPGIATVPFLTLNSDVVERGDRLVGSVHAAYFYRSLSLIGEWQYGYGGYANAARPDSVKVPYGGFYATAGYFLTGEEIERRTRVKPKRPLIPINSNETRGFGAWEIAGRVAQLRLGQEVFDSGFADPALWSNSVVTTELGLNWYWNEYTKIYMFWLHGEFGNPVQYRPGQYQKSADMFWTRFQLYF